MATEKQEQILDQVAEFIVECVDNDNTSSTLMDAFGALGIRSLNQRMTMTDEMYVAIREAVCGTIRKYL